MIFEWTGHVIVLLHYLDVSLDDVIVSSKLALQHCLGLIWMLIEQLVVSVQNLVHLLSKGALVGKGETHAFVLHGNKIIL